MAVGIPEWLLNVEIFTDEIYELIENGYDTYEKGNNFLIYLKCSDSNLIANHILYTKNSTDVRKKEIYMFLDDNLTIEYMHSKYKYSERMLGYLEDQRIEITSRYDGEFLNRIPKTDDLLIDKVDYMLNNEDAISMDRHFYERISYDSNHGIDEVYKDGKDYARISMGNVNFDGLVKAKIVKKEELNNKRI